MLKVSDKDKSSTADALASHMRDHFMDILRGRVSWPV